MNIPLSASKPDFQPPNVSDFMIRRDYLQTLNWPGIVHVVFPVIMPIVAVLGIIGNILTVIVLFNRKMKANTNTILFRTLALSDIVVVFVWTLNGVSEYYLFQVTEGVSSYLDKAYTKTYIVHLYFIYLSRGISIWTTIGLCIERFVFVCYPHKAHRWCSRKRAKIFIVVVVCFFLIFSIEQFLEFKPISYPCFGGECFINTFTEIGKAFYYSKIPFWINIMIYNIIPSILLISFSIPIVYKICNLYRQRHGNSSDSLGWKKREFQATIVILIVVIFSLLCNLNAPYFIAAYVYDIFNESYTVLAAIFNVIVLLNSSVNFLVYGVVGQRFRHIFLYECTVLWYKVTGRSVVKVDDNVTFTLSRSRDSCSIDKDNRSDDFNKTMKTEESTL